MQKVEEMVLGRKNAIEQSIRIVRNQADRRALINDKVAKANARAIAASNSPKPVQEITTDRRSPAVTLGKMSNETELLLYQAADTAPLSPS